MSNTVGAVAEYWIYGSRDGHRDVYAVCNIVELMAVLDGSPKADLWTPLEVQLEPVGVTTRYVDFMALTIFAPVITTRATEALKWLLDGAIELLPLDSLGDEELLVCNVPVLEGALNLEESSLRRFSTGKVMRIERPVFNDDVISGIPMFRVAEKSHGRVYVTEAFVTAIEAAEDLVGPALSKVAS